MEVEQENKIARLLIGFKEYLENKELAPRSIEIYCDQFLYFGMEIMDINQENVDKYIHKHLGDNVPRAFLWNFLNFLHRYGDKYGFDLNKVRAILLPEKAGHPSRKIPTSISEEEVWQIEREMKSERNKIMLLLLFYCGLRRTEMLNIKPFDFDWRLWDSEEKLGNKRIGKLKVLGKGGLRGKERIVYVPNFLMNRVEEWIGTVAVMADPNPANRLFKLRADTWAEILGDISMRALNKHVHPHQLRHGYANWLRLKGFPIEKIQHFMGHASITTTQIYTHIDPKELEDDFKQYVNV